MAAITLGIGPRSSFTMRHRVSGDDFLCFTSSTSSHSLYTSDLPRQPRPSLSIHLVNLVPVPPRLIHLVNLVPVPLCVCFTLSTSSQSFHSPHQPRPSPSTSDPPRQPRQPRASPSTSDSHRQPRPSPSIRLFHLVNLVPVFPFTSSTSSQFLHV